MRLIVGLFLVMFMFFIIGISLSQPALAGCKPCEAARQQEEEETLQEVQGFQGIQGNPEYAFSAAQTLADNIANGTALNSSVSAISRAVNATGSHVSRIINATGMDIEDIREVKEAASVFGSRIVRGIKENVLPAIEKVKNMTIYRMNNTPRISITRNIKLRVRPVEAEHEHIRINGTSLIVHNVTNPALQVQLVIRRNGSTMERNMTITRTRDMSRLNLTVGNATAFTDSEVIYENGAIYISRLNKTIELKALPDMVKDKARERWQSRAETAEILEMRLGMAGDRLRYAIKTRTRRHVLGLFPVDVDEESDASPETGEITATRGPWWGFLAW